MPELPADTVLHHACRQAGLAATGATPLRRHATDVYLLPAAGDDGIVAKIAIRSAAHSARRAVLLTRWLREHGFPCIAPMDVEQPVEVGDYVVTFWRYYNQHDRQAPGAAALGGLLRDLHRLPHPPIDLPTFVPLADFAASVAADASLSDDDRTWLVDERRRLLTAYGELDFPLSVGFIHGDAYPGNTIWAGEQVLLGDWDEPAVGPRELDLANTIQGGIRFGRTPAEVDAFTGAYGYDPRSWSGITTLIGLRDLHTLGSFLRRAGRGDSVAVRELSDRVASLRRRDFTSWRAA